MRFWFSILLVACAHVTFAADIAVVTLAAGDGYASAVAKGIENKRSFCKLHGYDFICATSNLDPNRPIAWSKILAILQAMENPEYKWIFWTDADSLVMNMGVSIEDFIDDKFDFIVSNDRLGMNTGQFLLKNNDWSRQFLLDSYAHTEVLNHPHWEQEAMRLECEKPEVNAHRKIIPQRLFNSYPLNLYSEETKPNLTQNYQVGDFILHFPGTRSLQTLVDLFNLYSPKVIYDLNGWTVDYYLGIYGFKLFSLQSKNNEGYISEPQKKQMEVILRRHPEISSIAEIGLNGGHSAELFFINCPNLKRFVSFDDNTHSYTQVAAEYFLRKYKSRFIFIPGTSHFTVKEYAAQFPHTKFDLIYIDGDHSYKGCFDDIVDCKKMAHKDTCLWINDYNGGGNVYRAVQECAKKGILKILESHDVRNRRDRQSWVECRYIM